MSDDALDLAYRELCPDGACTGLIGPDGRCKECGTVAPSQVSDPRNRHLDPDEDEPEYDDDRQLCPDEACIGLIGPDGACKECGARRDGSKAPAPAGDVDQDLATGSGPESDEFEDRILCSDDACIGLIGPDGRCKECGAPRAG